jgi:hypothetical protein
MIEETCSPLDEVLRILTRITASPPPFGFGRYYHESTGNAVQVRVDIDILRSSSSEQRPIEHSDTTTPLQVQVAAASSTPQPISRLPVYHGQNVPQGRFMVVSWGSETSLSRRYRCAYSHVASDNTWGTDGSRR